MKSLSEYKQELISKGYNANKRNQLYKIFKQKQQKIANPYKLTSDNWIDQYPLSKMNKYNANGKLKLFYDWKTWNTWHYCLKFVTIKPQFSQFFVQNGHVWINSIVLTKKLNISYNQMLLHIIESAPGAKNTMKRTCTTFSHTYTKDQMRNVLWFDLNDLKILKTLQTFNDYQYQWIKLLDDAIDTQEWIDTHPWAQTINNSTISGQGELERAIHTIAKLESQHKNHNQQLDFIIDHNRVWINATSHTIQPWKDTYTYFRHQKYLLFEGSC